MRGARGGRQHNRHRAPEGGWGRPEASADPPVSPAEPAERGYLAGTYPASPPPADAPVTGPDPESADPYYQRPDYPTDPGGIPLPHLAQGSAHSPD